MFVGEHLCVVRMVRIGERISCDVVMNERCCTFLRVVFL